MGSEFSYGALALLVATITAALALAAGERMRHLGGAIGGLSAGALLTLSLMHLVPKSLGMNDQALIFVAAGFVLALTIRTVVARYSKAGEEIVMLGGVTLHSVMDGLVLSVMGLVGAHAGAAGLSAMLMHEIPETLFCYFIARRALCSPLQSAVIASLIAGGATFASYNTAGHVLQEPDLQLLGALLAASGGFLIHAALSTLLSGMRARSAPQLAASLLGVALVVALLSLNPHEHHEHEHEHAHHWARSHDDHAHSPQACSYHLAMHDNAPGATAYRYIPADFEPAGRVD